MKGLVFSGGGKVAGLRPITDSLPKHLIPIANKPILVHVLDRVRAMGVTEVGVIVGDRASRIFDELGDGSRFGLSITYIQQDNPRGLAHGVALARNFLGDDDFVMYLGDCMLGDGILEVAEEFRSRRPAAQVVVAKAIDPARFGVVEIDPDGAVVSLVEKPEQPRDDLVLTGVYFFTSPIHAAVSAIEPSVTGESEITDAVQWLLRNGFEVVASQFDGPYTDVGRIPDVLDCNRMVLEDLKSSVAGHIDGFSEVIGPVVVEPGARIVRSRVEGPAVIGAGTTVEDSHVGPHTSIGRNCLVSSSDMNYSILMDGSTVSAVRKMCGSIIGRAATLSGRAARNRLLIGDHCRVDLV